jgi:hypothetical protein
LWLIGLLHPSVGATGAWELEVLATFRQHIN